MQEDAVVFPSNGETLFGVVHTPTRGELGNRVGLIMIPAGLQYRVGPCRLYVNVARKLCREGFHILRFDTRGIGDSEGDLGEKPVLDLWGEIEEGLFVENTLTAIDFFSRRNSIDTMLLGGLCGGAITALICASRCSRVGGLVLMGLPILKDSYAAKERLMDDENSHYYRREILRLQGWARLLSGRSDYLSVFRTLPHLLRGRQLDPLMNRLFLSSLRKVERSKTSMLLIYGERDKARQDFENRFWRRKEYRSERQGLRSRAEVHVLKGSDHVFSSAEWQRAVASLIGGWASKKFRGVRRGDKRHFARDNG